MSSCLTPTSCPDPDTGMPCNACWAQRGTVSCHSCGATHQAEYSHNSPHNGQPVYAVVCTVDWLTDYYTSDVVHPAPAQ
jgi:hypothetical protein